MTSNSFVIIFLLDYTCIIVNNIHKHPVKCLLTEKIQNKHFDHAFFVNFCDCLHENDHLPYSLPTMVQDTSKSQR